MIRVGKLCFVLLRFRFQPDSLHTNRRTHLLLYIGIVECARIMDVVNYIVDDVTRLSVCTMKWTSARPHLGKLCYHLAVRLMGPKKY